MRRRQFLNRFATLPLFGASEGTSSLAMPDQPQGQRSSAKIEKRQQGSAGIKSGAVGQRLQFPKVLVNHVGFRPDTGKYLVVDGVKGAERFEVVNMHQKGSKPSFVGKLARTGSDLGEYLIGDFSDLRQPGTYRVSVTGHYTFWGTSTLAVWSHNFTIADTVWDDPISKLVNYYRAQSCGASKYGYNSPCHTDKIRRDDGGDPQPITGGWHAAEDCVRDTPEILHGLFGLTYLALARPDKQTALNLFEEIRWGNDYLHAIQSREGYLPFGVYTVDYYDESRNWWDPGTYVLVTKPAAMYLQHNFIAIQALLARLFAKSQSEYASRCLDAGRRCFEYLTASKEGEWGAEKVSYELSTGILAGTQMFRATGREQYQAYAKEMANRLVSLQTARRLLAGAPRARYCWSP